MAMMNARNVKNTHSNSWLGVSIPTTCSLHETLKNSNLTLETWVFLQIKTMHIYNLLSRENQNKTKNPKKPTRREEKRRSNDWKMNGTERVWYTSYKVLWSCFGCQVERTNSNGATLGRCYTSWQSTLVFVFRFRPTPPSVVAVRTSTKGSCSTFGDKRWSVKKVIPFSILIWQSCAWAKRKGIK